MDEHGAGPSATAEHFDLAEGTVLSAFSRRRSLTAVEQATAKAAAVYVPLAELVPFAENPRKNEKAVAPVADSLIRFGWGPVITARADNKEIIGGHTRIKAALLVRSRWAAMSRPQQTAALMYWSADALALAQDEVPVVPVRYMPLDQDQARALGKAENKLGEIAVWDEDLLTAQFRETPLPELAGLGWNEKQIKTLLNPPAPVEKPTAPTVKEFACPHCGNMVRR